MAKEQMTDGEAIDFLTEQCAIAGGDNFNLKGQLAALNELNESHSRCLDAACDTIKALNARCTELREQRNALLAAFEEVLEDMAADGVLSERTFALMHEVVAKTKPPITSEAQQ